MFVVFDSCLSIQSKTLGVFCGPSGSPNQAPVEWIEAVEVDHRVKYFLSFPQA